MGKDIHFSNAKMSSKIKGLNDLMVTFITICLTKISSTGYNFELLRISVGTICRKAKFQRLLITSLICLHVIKTTLFDLRRFLNSGLSNRSRSFCLQPDP